MMTTYLETVAVVAAVLFGACAGPKAHPVVRTGIDSPPVAAASGEGKPAPTEKGPSISAHPVRSRDDMMALPVLTEGGYRIHLIDVGSGLAILVEGKRWRLLFDGGTSNDARGEDVDKGNSRLVAYLWAALGESGGHYCAPAHEGLSKRRMEPGVQRLMTIEHVILSHPHAEHGNLLADVLACYEAANIWDIGLNDDSPWYRDFWQAASKGMPGGFSKPELRTVAPIPPVRTRTILNQPITAADDVVWSPITEGLSLALDETGGAKLTVLHASANASADVGQNSLVLRLDLGATSLLLVGGAGSGTRAPPAAAVEGVEKHLLSKYPKLIDVDIIQVGAHGSTGGNRIEFLRAASPEYALISTSSEERAGVVVPEEAVLDALTEVGAKILRTDDHDTNGCPEANRIGLETGPGGCDNWVLVISAPP